MAISLRKMVAKKFKKRILTIEVSNFVFKQTMIIGFGSYFAF